MFRMVQPPTRDKAMLAPFATVIFFAALWLIAKFVVETIDESGGRIVDA